MKLSVPWAGRRGKGQSQPQQQKHPCDYEGRLLSEKTGKTGGGLGVHGDARRKSRLPRRLESLSRRCPDRKVHPVSGRVAQPRLRATLIGYLQLSFPDAGRKGDRNTGFNGVKNTVVLPKNSSSVTVPGAEKTGSPRATLESLAVMLTRSR